MTDSELTNTRLRILEEVRLYAKKRDSINKRYDETVRRWMEKLGGKREAELSALRGTLSEAAVLEIWPGRSGTEPTETGRKGKK